MALEQVEAGVQWVENQVLGEDIPDVSRLEVWIEQLQPIGRQLLERTFGFFTTTAEVGLQLVFVLVLILMLLGNPRPYRSLVIRCFPAFYRRRADDILIRCQQVLES